MAGPYSHEPLKKERQNEKKDVFLHWVEQLIFHVGRQLQRMTLLLIINIVVWITAVTSCCVAYCKTQVHSYIAFTKMMQEAPRHTVAVHIAYPEFGQTEFVQLERLVFFSSHLVWNS